MDRNGKNDSPSSKEDTNCHMCGASGVQVRKEEHRFEYGNAEPSVFLSAVVDVYSCKECSFEYTDSKADDLMHEAVCDYLGVLTPREILRIRESMKMSQKEFSKETGIGEASLSRWERGYLIQNEAMDNFLYLLSQPGNLEILRKRRSDSAEHVEPLFRNISDMEGAKDLQDVFTVQAMEPRNSRAT